jgi:hypothetical protein
MAKQVKPRKAKDVPVTQGMFFEFRNELLSQFISLKHQLKSFEQEIKADVHRIGLVVEQQRAENRFALDGYTNLYDRVAKLEAGEK